MMLRVRLTLFLLMSSGCFLFSRDSGDTKTAEFVLAPAVATKKNMSLNTLKEHVGKKTKQAFECTTSIGKNLGQVQSRLACLQEDVVGGGSHAASSLKDLLSACAAHNRVLGTIQHRVALLQQKFSSIIEKLIDNKPPFKKVSKKILEKSLAVLTTVQQQLDTCSIVLQRVSGDFKKSKKDVALVTASVQAATKELQAQATILQQAFTSIDTDQCLKDT